MKYTILGEHQKFFLNNHYVEFQQLLNPQQIEELKKSCFQSLALRLGIQQARLSERNFENTFNAGHDFFRQDMSIRKIVTKKNFAEIAFELSSERPLRLAYDQLFYSGKAPNQMNSGILQGQQNLKEISGLQGTTHGLMLCLDPGTNQVPQAPFSLEPGSGIYFSEKLPLHLDIFYQNSNMIYLLIVFCSAKSIVMQNQFFPFAYKQHGYATGDLLRDDLNPIVFR